MIILDNVTKMFHQRVALDHVSLRFTSGFTHVLLGSSGCGKSTLLRLILGLHTPDSGTITMAGAPIKTLTREALARQVGYVVQEGGLFPHLTAYQNVALPAEARKWSQQRLRARVAELAQMVGFSESTLQLYPVQLSGGQRQRVGLMRSLMLDPAVLLLDEPLAALDPIIRDDLQQQLKTIFRTLAKTVILVTHDIREAAIVGDTITLMTQGKVVQHGTFAQLLQQPATPFVTAFMRAQQPPSLLKEYL